mmetsp:Transcript_17712/g.48180  ORF Transcript_17712/g.48180 Transcript_17712/m.48180 type:complete len:242 (-) Transcript_17712:1297-2022(-)
MLSCRKCTGPSSRSANSATSPKPQAAFRLCTAANCGVRRLASSLRLTSATALSSASSPASAPGVPFLPRLLLRLRLLGAPARLLPKSFAGAWYPFVWESLSTMGSMRGSRSKATLIMCWSTSDAQPSSSRSCSFRETILWSWVRATKRSAISPRLPKPRLARSDLMQAAATPSLSRSRSFASHSRPLGSSPAAAVEASSPPGSTALGSSCSPSASSAPSSPSSSTSRSRSLLTSAAASASS